eukprot:21025_1
MSHVMSHNVKMFVTGNTAVGKTCFSYKFAFGTFPGEYVPTVIQETTVIKQLEINGKKVPFHIQISEVNNIRDYCNWWGLDYAQKDVIFICFSVASLSSFHNIEKQWYSETTHHCPHGLYILLGLKSDLRTNCVALVFGYIRQVMNNENINIIKEVQHLILKYHSANSMNESVNSICQKAQKISQLMVPKNEIEKLQTKLNIKHYIEVSALHDINVDKAIQTAIEQYCEKYKLYVNKPKKKRCIIM